MKIAVLSGKGGTGKTTVSASLAYSIGNCQYIDCDVEEPNGAIFLKPKIIKTIDICNLVPEVNEDKCTGCGECGRVCQFNAIAVIKGKVLLYPKICHSCGACMLACPQGAISEKDRKIGIIETNIDNTFMNGKLNIGEPISIPIIRELKKLINKDHIVILDCPPGASCAVVQSIENCNYCILVTEPTPFGLHDLKIAVKLVQTLNIPHGVVVNKATKGDSNINNFCKENGIEILMEIPFSQEIAQNYSKGILPVYDNSELKDQFLKLYKVIERGAKI